MSDLTPETIAEYPLRHAMRGYHVEQVDGLLDQVADRLESLESELRDSRRALAAAENQIEDATATEATLKRTLVTAQRAAEDTVAEAEARASRLVADAEEEAEQILADARLRAEQSDAEVAARLGEAAREADRLLTTARARVYELRRVADGFEAALRGHIDRHLRQLDELPTVDEPVDDGLGATDSPHAGGQPGAGPGQDTQPAAAWSDLFGSRDAAGGAADFPD